jgi:hypothetical protein
VSCTPIDDRVFDGLHAVIGRGHIGKFLEDLARPFVVTDSLSAAYQEMSDDKARDAEASSPLTRSRTTGNTPGPAHFSGNVFLAGLSFAVPTVQRENPCSGNQTSVTPAASRFVLPSLRLAAAACPSKGARVMAKTLVGPSSGTKWPTGPPGVRSRLRGEHLTIFSGSEHHVRLPGRS